MILSIGAFRIKENSEAQPGTDNAAIYHDLKIDFGTMTPERIAETLCRASQSVRVKVQNSELRPAFKRDGAWPKDGQTFDYHELYQRADKRPARETVLEREIQKAVAHGNHAHADILREILHNS